MGIADEEQKILEELEQIKNEPEEDTKDSEELLKEVSEDVSEEEEQEDGEVEDDETEDALEDDEEEEEDEEVEEENLAPAKMRHKLKAEKEARELRDRENQELRERLARLEGKAETEQKAQEEIPDQEYEPEKYAIYQNDKLREELNGLKAEQTRVNAERQWENMQAEHAQVNPNYEEAKAFLLEAEGKKLKAQYPYATDAQIRQELKKQEYITAGNAAKNGMVPTQHIEFLAFQAGYRPSEKTEEKPETKKKSNIKNIKKNARKNASLIGGSSAGETGDARSAEQLVAMSMQDINEFGRDKYEAAIRKIESRS